MSRAIAELSPDTRVLAARLAKLEPDQLSTWNELGALIGRAKPEDRGYLYAKVRSAARIVLRDHGIVIATVMREGVKRLRAENVYTVGEQTTAHIRRRVRYATRTIVEGTKGAVLDNASRVAVHTQLAMLGVMDLVTANKSINRIEQAVKDHKNGELPPATALDIFK